MTICELRRETIRDDVSIFKGSAQDCIDYMNETIERNAYDYTLMTDINMKPMWSMKHAAYYLREVSNDI